MDLGGSVAKSETRIEQGFFTPTPPAPSVSTTGVTPVLWWAGAGVIGLAVWAYIWITWFATGEATPTGTGPDPVPAATKVWVWVFQIASVAVAAGTIAYVVRMCRREHRLTFDAMLVMGWFSIWWQDPLLNYVRPQFFYNAYAPNLGSWSERIPGWISPNGAKLPAHLLLTGGSYIWMMVLSLLFCAVCRRANRMWPGLNKVQLFLVGFTSIVVFDLVFETIAVRTQVFVYPGAIHRLSLFGGKWYQFPVYEAVLAGAFWSSSGALRYFRDDKGASIVERGIDKVNISTRGKTTLRALALVGFMNVAFLVTYNIPYAWIAMYVDKTPELPSYLRAGICGAGTGYACADPTLPVPLPDVPPAPARTREAR